jgi:hypothetical protein
MTRAKAIGNGNIVGADGSTTFVAIRYLYNAADPWAITLRFLVEGQPPANWTFSRDLLRAALASNMTHGHGDVVLTRVHPDTLVIELEAPDGDALVVTTVHAAKEVIRQSLLLVPAGTEKERVDVDGEYAALLAEEASS